MECSQQRPGKPETLAEMTFRPNEIIVSHAGINEGNCREAEAV